MVTGASRRGFQMALKDSDNIARLEALRPRFARLRDQKIRADAEVERAAADLEKAKEHARKVAGTDNEDQIREQIRASYERNTKAVDEFEAVIAAVEAELSAIGSQT
jgi:hypothetical protein